MYVYILELSIVSELLWFERERERGKESKESKREGAMSVIDLFEVALLWQARMCRMSYKKARICGH